MALNGLFHLVLAHEAENIRQRREVRVIQKKLRDVSNPFNLPDKLFLRLFRLNKECAQILIESLTPHMERSQRATKILVHLRVLTAVHFFDQGSYQMGTGHNYTIAQSQPAVSRCISEITDLMVNHLLNKWIKFSTTVQELQQIKAAFQQLGPVFTDTIGIIDGTHVRIIAPPANHPVYPGHAYYCRKGFYSINTQIICDSNRVITNINARFPGSVHGSAIWMMSSAKRLLQQNYEQTGSLKYLHGDGGYPLEPWLMVPFLQPPENTPQSRFNSAHSERRIIIEPTYGLLKARFRSVHGHRALHYNPLQAGKIIYSCAILHNMCRIHNVPLPNNEEFPVPQGLLIDKKKLIIMIGSIKE